MFETKITAEYHEDMNAGGFEQYPKQMVTFLSCNSIIVMDNGNYHSRKTERLPSNSWQKREIFQ